jgi:protein gp37
MNPWVGCHKVSAGCDNCYAEDLVNRLPSFDHDFGDVKIHLNRLTAIRKMRPHTTAEGKRPYLCFVNSMSDFWHQAVPDSAIHTALDAFEAAPHTIFQVLTKRPIRARQILTARYGNAGVPRNVWIGVSAEDNRVAARLNILRTIKDRTGGGGTFFVSVEPIVGPTDELDFTGCDWVITGGESGPRARVMERPWLLSALERAQRAGAAIWHKQNGSAFGSHPNSHQVPRHITKPAEQMRWLRQNGLEVLPDEKGGATVDGKTYREMPRSYYEIAEELN